MCAFQTRQGVEVEVQVFHAEERLYTLLMIDPGAFPLSFAETRSQEC